MSFKQRNEKTEENKIFTKIEKISEKEELINYLKAQIEWIQKTFGNQSDLLFKLTEKLIHVYKSKADHLFDKKEFEQSLENYKKCYKLTEPLPGSGWDKNPIWSKNRITIMKSLALNFEKLKKYEKAIEFLRLGINLEETYSVNNEKQDYDSKFNRLYLLVANHLLILDQHLEALKYLTRLENKMSEDYQIKGILNRKRVDKKINRKFIQESPAEYLKVLNMICKLYVKLGKYNESESFYNKKEELSQILLKQNLLDKHLLENDVKMQKEKFQEEISKEYIEEEKEKTYDKAERTDSISSTIINNYNLPIRRSVRSASKNVNNNNNEQKIKAQSADNNHQNQRTKIKKLTRVEEKKLKQLIQESNKYLPLNFKFKKPIFHPIKKLPMIDLSYGMKKKKIFSLPKKRKLKLPSLDQKSGENMKPKIKLNKISEIQKKLNQIDVLQKQNSLKSLSRSLSHTSNKKVDNLSKLNKINSVISSTEDDGNQKVNLYSIKKSQKDYENKDSKTSKAFLPPLSLSNINKEIANQKKFIFASSKVNLDEISSNETPKSTISQEIKKRIPQKASKTKIEKKKEKGEEPNFVQQDVEEDKNNKNKILQQKEAKINFKPVDQDFKSKAKIEIIKKKEPISTINVEIENIAENMKIKIEPKNLSTGNLAEKVIEYFNFLKLNTSKIFDKDNILQKLNENEDISLIKTIDNIIFKINFKVPMLFMDKDNKSYISIDIFFDNLDGYFSPKFNIKILINKEQMRDSESLLNGIQTCINLKEKNYKLVWAIVLFYFENWFSIFRKKYETLLQEDANFLNKEFYKNFLNKINDYIVIVTKSDPKKIVVGNEEEYNELLFRYFFIFLKFIELEKNLIGTEIKIKKLDRELIKSQKLKKSISKNKILDEANYLNSLPNTILLKSKFEIHNSFSFN